MYTDHKTKHDRMNTKPQSRIIYIGLMILVALALLGAMHADHQALLIGIN